MNASFNGIRRSLARNFNSLARTKDRLDGEQRKALSDMRATIAGLLCLYEEDNLDSVCLIDTVHLEEVEGDEDEDEI